MTVEDDVSVNKYLVQHDYGMGALLWWVRADSPEQILETLAEVEVLPDRTYDGEELDEVRLDALPEDDETLIELRDQRAAQRGHPGYGALLGRSRVYLRDDDEEYEGGVFLSEVGPDGRMLRQVEQQPGEPAIRDSEFPINPPVDLRDPKYVDREISAAEFERAWSAAIDRPDD